MGGLGKLFVFILPLSSFLHISQGRNVRSKDLSGYREVADLTIEHRHINVTDNNLESCVDIRQELQVKSTLLQERTDVNSRLAIKLTELQVRLSAVNRNSGHQISVLEDQLQEALRKLEKIMKDGYVKGVSVIEINNFLLQLEKWTSNQNFAHIAALQDELEKRIGKLQESSRDNSKLLLEILSLRNQLTQQTSGTSDHILDLQRKLQAKTRQLGNKSEQLNLNEELLLEILDLQSRIWNLEKVASNQTTSDDIPNLLKQLEMLVNELPAREGDDSKLVLKLLMLQSTIRELQKYSTEVTDSRKVTELQRKLAERTQEQENILDQLKRRGNPTSEMLPTIIELMRQQTDLQIRPQNQTFSDKIDVLLGHLKNMDKSYSQLQNSYNALFRRLENTTSQLNVKTTANSNLVLRVAELERMLEGATNCSSAEITALKNEMEEMITELNEKTNDNSKLVLQILTLHTQVNNLQSSSSAQIDELKKQLKEKTEDLRNKTRHLEIKTDLNSQLVLQILELQGIIWDLETGKSNRTSYGRIADLLQLLESKIDQLENNGSDDSKLVLKIFSLQSIVRELQRESINQTGPDETIAVQKKLEQKNKELDETLRQLNDTHNENSKQLAKIVELQGKLVENQAPDQTVLAQIDGMRKELRDLESRHSNLQNSYDELQRELKNMEEEYAQLKARYNDLLNKSAEGSEVKSKLQKQLADKNEEYSMLQSRYNELKKQLVEKNEKCSHLQSAYDDIKTLLEAKQTDNEKLRAIYNDLKKQNTEKKMQYLRLQDKYKDLENEIQKKAEDYNKLQSKYNELQNDMEEKDSLKIKTPEVFLDPDTAHPRLVLSVDRSRVRAGNIWRNVPDTPQRFDVSLAVLGQEGFTSGRRYWEVQVSGRSCFCVGMAKDSAPRKGRLRVKPTEGYWTLIKNRQNEYRALANSAVTLNPYPAPNKLGVLLDYEGGKISFYNPESRTHIYTFSGNIFKEKLFAFILTCEDAEPDESPIIISSVSKDVSWIK